MSVNPAATIGPLRAEGLSKSFGERSLWSGLSFTCNPGDFIALSGPSGSGKTTLLNCLGLLEPLDAGQLTFGPRDLRRLSPRGRRLFFRNSTGFLFQGYGLVDSWSGARNLAVALEYSRLDRRQRSALISDSLAAVGLEGAERRKVYTLSGGEQQRLALARLMLKRPQLILVDEPTAALDEANASVVVNILRAFASDGAIVVSSTHDQGFLDGADKVISVAV